MLIEWFPTFNYFNTWHAFDPCQDILDFGSNRGNLIHSSMDKISPTQYTGIDVDLEALVEGKKLFPQANWVHYNRYNTVYNKQGDASLPSLPKKYHAIFSYSVFTHMSMEDTISLVDHLMNHNLKENGKFYLSWCNIDYPPCVKWFQSRRENCDDIASDDFCYLIDNKVAKSPAAHHANYFVTFYRQEFLAKIFSNYTIDYYPPPHGWVQHCMCLQN